MRNNFRKFPDRHLYRFLEIFWITNLVNAQPDELLSVVVTSADNFQALYQLKGITML